MPLELCYLTFDREASFIYNKVDNVGFVNIDMILEVDLFFIVSTRIALMS